YSLDYSLVRARDPRSGDYLPWIPSDRLRNALTWQYAGYRKGLPALYLTLQHEWVARQTRYQPERDFAPPPRRYHLWNLEGATRWSHPGHELLITVSVQNLGNSLYRDYMNRLRYYAHDKVRAIRIQITFRTKIYLTNNDRAHEQAHAPAATAYAGTRTGIYSLCKGRPRSRSSAGNLRRPHLPV